MNCFPTLTKTNYRSLFLLLISFSFFLNPTLGLCNSLDAHEIGDPWEKIAKDFYGQEFYPEEKGWINIIVWGNYCGWGNYSEDYSLEPVDDIDAACMEHDKCYDERGRFDCVCDESLTEQVRDLYETYSRQEGFEAEARMSKLIWLTFKFNTCDKKTPYDGKFLPIY